MRVIFNVSIAIFLIVIGVNVAHPEENLFPAGYNISLGYMISSQEFNIYDTVLISRSLINNENFDLDNLYFEDNLPGEFSVILSSVEINDMPISYYFSGAITSEVLPSYKVYRWAVDLPDSGDVYNNKLHPGDILGIEYAVSCSTAGEYYLPFHTLACFGDNTGIFTTADSIPLTVTGGQDIPDSPAAIPDKILISVAYPNPFNAGVSIKLNGFATADRKINFRIYDLLGNKVYDGIKTVNDDLISWYPAEGIASGLYFYVIQSQEISSSGKITLLK